MRTLKTLSAIFLTLLISLGLSYAEPQAANEITDIRVQKQENQVSVFVDFNKIVTYESYTLKDPLRLVLDFKGVDKISPRELPDIYSCGVLKVRTGKPKPNTGRVVFDFMDKIPAYQIKDTASGLQVVFFAEQAETKPAEVAPQVAKKEEAAKVTAAQPRKAAETTPAEVEAEFPEETTEKMFGIGAVTGFYFMQDEAFQDIYGKSALFFGGDFSVRLPIKSVKSIDFCLGFKYLQDKGKTDLMEEETKLTITDFSLAVRYLKTLGVMTPFIGPGVNFIHYKETYGPGFPVESMSGSEVGFHIQGGTYINITSSLAAKLYFRYIIAKTRNEEIDLNTNIGGTEWGAGLTFRF